MSRHIFLLSLLVNSNFAFGAELKDHEQQVIHIKKQTDAFELQMKDLMERKKDARRGPELEDVLTEIGNLHKSIITLRKERNDLRDHLLAEHPDSPLTYQSYLHKSFDRSEKAQKTELDDKLDDLQNLLQKQYGRKAPTSPEKTSSVTPAKKQKKGEAGGSVVTIPTAPARPLSKEELKEIYLREQLKSEMKVKADPAAQPAPTPPPKEKKAEESKGHH